MQSRRTTSGITLIELMVAMSVFLILGGALVMFLNTGIRTWRVGEARREAFERAQAILETLADDLSSTFPDPSRGNQGEVDVIFLSDYDDQGRQRLRFVRTLAGEMRHPITQDAGSLTGGLGEYDYMDDAWEAKHLVMRAPGGLQEIAYVFDWREGSELLWRGVKSPVGGAGTLFDDANIYNWEPTEDDPLPMHRCRPFVDGVLYLEFNFWGRGTRSWDAAEDEASARGAWDSTGGILEPRPSTRHEYRDDEFPSRVQVILTLRPSRATRFGRLRADIDESDMSIRVDTTRGYPDGAFHYIKIDDEWIRYETRDGKTFHVAEDGRGVRGSLPAPHLAGAPAVWGYSFSRVVRIPGSRFTRWGAGR